MNPSPTTSTNPYISLMKTAWKYAQKERKKYVFIYLRFAASNLVHALEPIIWGLFINQVQLQGAEIIHSAWLLVFSWYRQSKRNGFSLQY